MSSLFYLTLATLATSTTPSGVEAPADGPPQRAATSRIATPISEHDEAPLTDPPSYDRKPWAVSLAAQGHIDCVWERQRCRSGTLLMTLVARQSGFFAWQINLGHSVVHDQEPGRLTLLAGGARLHALDATALDPFVGLSLGAEYVRRPSHGDEGFNLATELVFGLHWLVSETIGLGPTLSFRQGFRRVTSCDGFSGCGSWYSERDRWVALGLELSLGFGAPL